MGSNPKILRQNPPWGPDRVWGDHCSSIPRVQQKHPISRLLSGHAGDFSPFRHPDWELGRCSFRPSPRKATAPSPPTPTPSSGSSSTVGSKRDLPCPRSLQKKKRGQETLLLQQPPDPLHVAGQTPDQCPVLSSQQQHSEQTNDTTRPPTPHAPWPSTALSAS